MMATTVMGTSTPVTAAEALQLTTLRAEPEAAPASVLGLDSDDAKVGSALTLALRDAFANRGIGGGEEISLEEMRLVMGCDNDGADCLAQGGKNLGVSRLIFGYLRGTGGGKFQLIIQILDTETGALESDATVDLTSEQLTDANIYDTAVEIVETLLPSKTEDDTPAVPTPGPADGEGDEEEEPGGQGGIYFGLEKPTPTWKWAGFGSSLALTVIAGGATVGMGLWLTRPNFGFRPQLLEAAEASLTDSSSLNDVDPSLPEMVDLCDFARSRPVDANGVPLGQPGQVRNSAVVAVCNRGEDVRRVQLITGIGTAVFGVATLAFTGLLLIHKKKPTADAMLRHGVGLGLAPTTLDGGSRGLSIAGSMKF